MSILKPFWDPGWDRLGIIPKSMKGVHVKVSLASSVAILIDWLWPSLLRFFQVSFSFHNVLVSSVTMLVNVHSSGLSPLSCSALIDVSIKAIHSHLR